MPHDHYDIMCYASPDDAFAIGARDAEIAIATDTPVSFRFATNTALADDEDAGVQHAARVEQLAECLRPLC